MDVGEWLLAVTGSKCSQRGRWCKSLLLAALLASRLLTCLQTLVHRGFITRWLAPFSDLLSWNMVESLETFVSGVCNNKVTWTWLCRNNGKMPWDAHKYEARLTTYQCKQCLLHWAWYFLCLCVRECIIAKFISLWSKSQTQNELKMSHYVHDQRWAVL